MKTFTRFGFLAVAIVLFFNAFAVTETKAQDPTNEILKRMQEHRTALKTLRADVTMSKYNSQLNDSDVPLQGNVTYLPGKTERDMYIRLNWVKPVEEQLSVIKGEYLLYSKSRNQVIIGKVDQAKNSAGAGNALSFMSMSKDQLKANYTVKYLGEETVSGGAKTWHLQLTPKMVSKYKLAEIWIDGNGMPIQAKITENNSDTTTVLLSNLHKNETISAKVFTIDYPKNIKPIKG